MRLSMLWSVSMCCCGCGCGCDCWPSGLEGAGLVAAMMGGGGGDGDDDGGGPSDGRRSAGARQVQHRLGQAHSRQRQARSSSSSSSQRVRQLRTQGSGCRWCNRRCWSAAPRHVQQHQQQAAPAGAPAGAPSAVEGRGARGGLGLAHGAPRLVGRFRKWGPGWAPVLKPAQQAAASTVPSFNTAKSSPATLAALK